MGYKFFNARHRPDAIENTVQLVYIQCYFGWQEKLNLNNWPRGEGEPFWSSEENCDQSMKQKLGLISCLRRIPSAMIYQKVFFKIRLLIDG